jgi:hypothetical protein
MLRKIISGILIIFSSIMLGLSIAGVSLIWMDKVPLTQTSIARLTAIDNEFVQAQTAIQSAKIELERTQRIVESAEASMQVVKDEFAQAKLLFGSVNGTLDTQLIPGLKASRAKLDQVKSSLIELKLSLEKINALPYINLNFPGDQLLADLINDTGFLDGQIAQGQTLVQKASAFMGDTSYLLGSDFTETKASLQNFLRVMQEYDQKLTDWRSQLANLMKSLPGWINTASMCLTVFLLWFGISQVSMIKHGLSLWQDGKIKQESPKTNPAEMPVKPAASSTDGQPIMDGSD